MTQSGSPPGGSEGPESRSESSPFLLTEVPSISRQIAALGEVRTYAAGEFVYRQGTASAFFYQIVTGRVRIFLTRADGTERVLSYAEPGASFGESTCFDGLPRYASSVAICPSRILAIPRDAVIEAGRRRPEVLLEIARRLSRKQRLLSMHIMTDGLPARGRVVVVLDQLLDAYGSVAPDASARLRVQHSIDELALMIGLTRVTTSREISQLVSEGVVVKEGREIVVRDVAGLRSRAREYWT
jgi:CRP/FNR family transcriptional regulator, cyclic AMP receptor protein